MSAVASPLDFPTACKPAVSAATGSILRGKVVAGAAVVVGAGTVVVVAAVVVGAIVAGATVIGGVVVVANCVVGAAVGSVGGLESAIALRADELHALREPAAAIATATAQALRIRGENIRRPVGFGETYSAILVERPARRTAPRTRW